MSGSFPLGGDIGNFGTGWILILQFVDIVFSGLKFDVGELGVLTGDDFPFFGIIGIQSYLTTFSGRFLDIDFIMWILHSHLLVEGVPFFDVSGDGSGFFFGILFPEGSIELGFAQVFLDQVVDQLIFVICFVDDVASFFLLIGIPIRFVIRLVA